jgi:flagellar biosynthesis protein FlhA
MNPGNDQRPLSGAIPTTEPAFGLPAMWVPEQQKLEAEMAGYTVVDPTTVLITHLSEIIKTHAHEVLTRQDAQALVDKVRASSPALVDELVPKVMSLSEVHRILQNLLRERVPIRDLNRILSVMGDYIGTTRDLDQLTEYVRQALARAISRYHQGTDGAIDVFTLDPALEEMMLDHLRPTQFNTQVVLDPLLAQQLLTSVKAHAERAIAMGNQPIVLCSSQIRPYFRRLVERYLPGITVLSHAEIAPGVQVRSSGTVVVS